LHLQGNYNLTSINSSLLLPTTVRVISFSACGFTTAGYTASEFWANGMHNAPSNDSSINFNNNADSVNGTNLKTILTNKGWNVIA
jgi:hypothetical protein